MNVFDWAADEIRSSTLLCHLVEHQPILAHLRWNTGVGMDLVRAGLRVVVVGFTGALLALVGITVSLLSSLLLYPRDAEKHPRLDNLRRRADHPVRAASDILQHSEIAPQNSLSPPQNFGLTPAQLTSSPSPVDIPASSRRHNAAPTPGSEASSHASSSFQEFPFPQQPSLPVVPAEKKSRKRCPPTPIRALSLMSSCAEHFHHTEAGPSTPPLAKVQSVPLADLKERVLDCCPVRQHSLPTHTEAQFIPRTNPYAAPYFFPTPASPEAVDYVQQVRRSRATGHPPASRPNSSHQDDATVVESPRSRTIALPSPPAADAPSAQPGPDFDEVGSSPRAKGKRRWSWHNPPAHLSPRWRSSSKIPRTQTSESAPAAHETPSSPGRSPPKGKLLKSRSGSSHQPNGAASPPPSNGNSDVRAISSPPMSAPPTPSLPNHADTSRKHSWRTRLSHRRTSSNSSAGTAEMHEPRTSSRLKKALK
ncbi:uncharacterized protein FIBRA_03619 [Fibroporia radiculosa]|uniref:Uncharacterized protein n=1 Tax=Fibroporia radiculosa TaxID=599839 RepID=J4GNK7_9APHY|nr:uncharacterized protein FIBRA_03619 [Fibroporia radiculosa]CCM01560.1 predicted protein [Fibroporia radiculosa]